MEQIKKIEKACAIDGQTGGETDISIPEAEILRCITDIANEIVKSVKEYEIAMEQERTKRYAVRAHKEVLLEKIQAQKEIIEKIIDKTFDERSKVLYELIKRLDVGIQEDNEKLISLTIGGIVGIVQSTPFKSF